MRISRGLFALLLTAATLLASRSAIAQDATPPGDAAHGKVLFTSTYGCWECHGRSGQGNFQSGPAVAPHPIPYAAFVTQLRSPRAAMPPYGPAILSDRALADIYAYLRSILATKPSTQIPLLAEVDAGKAPTTPGASVALGRGKTLFAANCAACHGASGTEGGAGPSLAGEKHRKGLDQTIVWIENPAPPMPKRYPSPLSQRDVADVAAYIESL